MALKRSPLFIFSIIIFFIVAAYVSFPWWGKLLVKSQLPQDWHLTHLELGYPSLKTLPITQIQLRRANYQFSIDDILLDLDANTVAINTLNITTTQAKSSSTKPEKFRLSLPVIDFNSVFASLPFEQLTVENLTWQDKQQNLHIGNIEFKLLPEYQAKLKASVVKSAFLKKNTQLHLNINYQQQMHSSLSVDNRTVLNATYTNLDEETQLEIQTQLESLQDWLPTAATDNINNLNGQLKILVSNKSNDDSTSIALSLNGNATFAQFNQQQLNFNWKASSNSQHWPLAFTSNLQLASLTPLQFNAQLNADSVNMNIQNTLKINQTDIIIEDLVINAKAAQATFQQQEVISKVSNLALTTAPLSFHLAQLDLAEKTLNIELTSEQIQLQQNDAVSGQAKLDAKLSFSPTKNPIVSGTIELTNLSLGNTYQSLNSKISVLLDKVALDNSSGAVIARWTDEDFQIQDFSFSQLESEFETQLSTENIAGKGWVKIDGYLLTPVEFAHYFDTGESQLTLPQNNIEPEFINTLLAQIRDKSLPEVSIIDGEIEHQASFNVEGSSLSSLSSIKNATIMLDQNQANQVNINNQLISGQKLTANSSIRINDVLLSSGLEIKKISTQINSDGETININNLEMTLLEGAVKSEEMTIQDNHLSPSKVLIKHLSLTELIQFMDLSNFFAQGKVDFTIPIEGEGLALTVKNAEFKNIDKGVIKYLSGDELQQTQNIALQALANFHYTELDGTLDYDKDGNYKIKLHLLGSNPDLYDGYPVDFVLNLNGKLPGLFKSLFLSGSFEESILESVRSENSKK